MLEAVNADLVFTISLKRSTQSVSYPQAAGRLPHLSGVKRTSKFKSVTSAFDPRAEVEPASSRAVPPPIQRNNSATCLGSALMNALAAHSDKRRATTPSRNADSYFNCSISFATPALCALRSARALSPPAA